MLSVHINVRSMSFVDANGIHLIAEQIRELLNVPAWVLSAVSLARFVLLRTQMQILFGYNFHSALFLAGKSHRLGNVLRAVAEDMEFVFL